MFSWCVDDVTLYGCWQCGNVRVCGWCGLCTRLLTMWHFISICWQYGILTMLRICWDTLQMRLVKRNIASEHAQNARMHIILRMRKVSTGHLLSFHTFCEPNDSVSGKWFDLTRLRGCAGWSRLSLSQSHCLYMPEDTFPHGAAHLSSRLYHK